MSKFEEGDLNAPTSAPTDLDESAVAHLAGEDEGENKHFSKSIQMRIGKEVKKRKVLEVERDTFRTEAERATRELAEMKLKRAEERKAAIEAEAETLKNQAQVALEEGESENYMQLNDTMLDRKVELSRVNATIEAMPAPAPATASGPSAAAQSWLDDNADWLKDDKEKAARAQMIEAELKSRGYSVQDPKTYEELNRRLDNDGMLFDEEIAEDRRPPADATPVNVPGSHVPNTAEGRGKRLSRDDLVTMRQYGLNPKNPAHRAEWLSSKTGA